MNNTPLGIFPIINDNTIDKIEGAFFFLYFLININKPKISKTIIDTVVPPIAPIVLSLTFSLLINTVIKPIKAIVRYIALTTIPAKKYFFDFLNFINWFLNYKTINEFLISNALIFTSSPKVFNNLFSKSSIKWFSI